jgi:hypothetical protein
MSLCSGQRGTESPEDIEMHLKNVKEIFDQIDPSGKKGINYI